MVIEELKEIEECLVGIPIVAQSAWIREFGLEVVLNVLPTAYAAWMMEKPKQKNTNQIQPFALYARKCMKYEKTFPMGTGTLDYSFLEKKNESRNLQETDG